MSDGVSDWLIDWMDELISESMKCVLDPVCVVG